jgi:hypothetical protein
MPRATQSIHVFQYITFGKTEVLFPVFLLLAAVIKLQACSLGERAIRKEMCSRRADNWLACRRG